MIRHRRSNNLLADRGSVCNKVTIKSNFDLNDSSKHPDYECENYFSDNLAMNFLLTN